MDIKGSLIYILIFLGGIFVLFGVLGLLATFSNSTLEDPVEKALEEVTSRKKRKRK